MDILKLGNIARLNGGVVMGWFTNFVADLTGSSSSQTAAAHHTARDDSGVREGKDSSYFEKSPDWAEKTTPEGRQIFPDGK